MSVSGLSLGHEEVDAGISRPGDLDGQLFDQSGHPDQGAATGRASIRFDSSCTFVAPKFGAAAFEPVGRVPHLADVAGGVRTKLGDPLVG